jgi:hypothetical protein
MAFFFLSAVEFLGIFFQNLLLIFPLNLIHREKKVEKIE